MLNINHSEAIGLQDRGQWWEKSLPRLLWDAVRDRSILVGLKPCFPGLKHTTLNCSVPHFHISLFYNLNAEIGLTVH